MTIKLITRTDEVNADVIERLEHILARAKKGEILGVAIAYHTSEMGAGTSFSKTDDFGRLLGAAALLQYRLCKE